MATRDTSVQDRLRAVLGMPADISALTDRGIPPPPQGLSRAVLVSVVVAIAFAVVVFMRSQPVTSGAPVSIGTPLASQPAASPTPTLLVVQVVGRVNRPGIVRLPMGARVADAVAAAGGLMRRTDPASVNLARPIVDGEQIVIAQPNARSATSPTGNSPASGASPAGGSATVLDLNSATASELQALPGVGPVLAQRIVEQRTRLGRFTSVQDLRDVSGIGPKKFAELAPLVRV